MAKAEAKRVVILGAGVSGLTAAYTLSRKGFNCLLIERNGFVGGLARSFLYQGHHLDYGPHNFHTYIPRVAEFLRNDLGVSLKKIPAQSTKIFFNGKVIDYPINIFNSLHKVNLMVGIRCFLDFVKARIAIKFRSGKNDDSFESWIESRFGRQIYKTFFGSYIEKLWGIPGYELDAVIAKRKIPEPSFLRLVLRAVTGIKLSAKHSEDPEAVSSYYPREGGIGVISERMSEFVTRSGGRIELDSRISSLDISAAGGELRYSVNSLDKKAEFDYLINTIPLNTFMGYLSSGGGSDTDETFPYRGMVFLYLLLNRPRISKYPWFYFNASGDPDLIFNRMYDVGNFSSGRQDQGSGVICIEIPCYKGDSLWGKTDEELFRPCAGFLERNGFLRREDIKDYFTKRVDAAYPVFRKGYLPRLQSALDSILDKGNIFTIGRQGLFSYVNIDHCIDMGLRLEGLVKGDKIDNRGYLDMYKDYIG